MRNPKKIVLTKEQREHLLRDYEKCPLKRGEKIIEEDLRYLYLDLNLSDYELMYLFGKSQYYIQHNRYIYGIYKSKEQIIAKRGKTNLETYGVKCPLVNKEVHEKSRVTCLRKYGVENVMQSKEIQERFKQTSLQKYKTEYPFQNKDVQEKYKQTCMKNNGCEWGLSFKLTRDKIKKTCLDKYGVENPAQTRTVQEKMRATCLDKYGAENFTQSVFYNGSEVTYKAYETKKKRKTVNTSKAEKQIFEKLSLKFSSFNSQCYQYKCERYPYNCDFYVPEMDLFIEYQGHWTHGRQPFNKDDYSCQEILDRWNKKAKNSKFYQEAIVVWTYSDPLKRETARKNNLNWIEFFNMKQFMEWYKNL